MEGVSEETGTIMENQIRNSLGDANYDRVVEVMKDELIAYEEPSLYNDSLRYLKKTVPRNELAGDRRELWWLIKRCNVEEHVGTITCYRARSPRGWFSLTLSLQCHMQFLFYGTMDSIIIYQR